MGVVSSSSTVSLLQVANAFMRVCNVEIYKTAGSGSATVPSYARGVIIACTGAGGGGNTTGGGGGGGTVYLHRLVTSGQTISFVLGTGGATGSGSASGGIGTESNVTINGVTYSAYGGQGGSNFQVSGVTISDGDFWGLNDILLGASASTFESAYGLPGETDGTGGEPGLWQEGIIVGANSAPGGITPGTGGIGGVSRRAGGPGIISFKWLACPIQTDVYTGGQSGTATAPTDAEFVVIKAWGAGGAGRNNPGPAGNPGGGGGGGGFVIKRIPVSAGNTFTYGVGIGGVIGTNSGNGGNTTISGNATIDAGGGGGGTLGSGGAGGIASGGDADSEAGTAGNGTTGVPGFPGRYNNENANNANFVQGAYTYAGLPGTDPIFDDFYNPPYGTPGQGGTGEFEGGHNPGANGEIRFEWFSSKVSLSKFRANSTITTGFSDKIEAVTTPNNAAGYNGMIVESGNIDLLDFRDATLTKIMSYPGTFKSRASSVTYSSTSAYARANLVFRTSGEMLLSEQDDSADGQFNRPQAITWLLRGASGTTVNSADEFDIKVTKTGGSDPIEGLANNTWYNMNQEREWYVSATASSPSSPAPNGVDSKTCNVTVDIRRTDTDVVLKTFSVSLFAFADSNAGPPP